MHHTDTHTHAQSHAHQKQWAVKCCHYPPQTASTNQIRPDQNMPFKGRAGAGAFRGGQLTLWPWEQLAWPGRERDRDWEKEREWVGGRGWGVSEQNKEQDNAEAPPTSLHLQIRDGALWGRIHKARFLPTSPFPASSPSSSNSPTEFPSVNPELRLPLKKGRISVSCSH